MGRALPPCALDCPEEWVHVVGVWDAGAECTAYLNGRRGDSTSANNGKGADVDEELVIGGHRHVVAFFTCVCIGVPQCMA